MLEFISRRVLILAIVASTAGIGQEATRPVDTKKAIADALGVAKNERKHVLLNFGADWCLECRILDKMFAEPSAAAFLRANFVVVPVPVGRMVGLNYAELNSDVIRQYGVFTTPENAGIPSIVILDAGGAVLARTDKGEWRHKETLTQDVVIRALKAWAPERKP
jgi:thioredoxin 1